MRLAIVALAVVTAVASAAPIRTGVDVDALFRSSDSVAVVDAVGFARPHQTTGGPVGNIVTVRVVKTLAGQQLPVQSDVVCPDGIQVSAARFRPGARYVVFLQQNSIGAWVMNHAVGGIGAEAETDGLPKDPHHALIELLRRSLMSKNPTVQIDVLTTLAQLDGQGTLVDEVRELSGNSDDRVAAWSLIYRFNVKDLVDPKTAVSLLERKSTTLTDGDRLYLAIHAIQDNRQLPVGKLNQLLWDSESREVRFAAVMALYHRGDASSVGPLWKALSYPDQETRVVAHWGLKRITNRNVPYYSEFAARSEDVSEDWREWIENWKADRELDEGVHRE